MFFHTKTYRSNDFFHNPKTDNPYNNGGYQFSPEIRNDLPQCTYQRIKSYIHFSSFVYRKKTLAKILHFMQEKIESVFDI
jgi:hypothetical protein